VIVVLLPETLSFLAEYRLLLFGALLFVVLMIAPEGVVGALAARFGRTVPTSIPDRPPLDLASFLKNPPETGREARHIGSSGRRGTTSSADRGAPAAEPGRRAAHGVSASGGSGRHEDRPPGDLVVEDLSRGFGGVRAVAGVGFTAR